MLLLFLVLSTAVVVLGWSFGAKAVLAGVRG